MSRNTENLVVTIKLDSLNAIKNENNELKTAVSNLTNMLEEKQLKYESLCVEKFKLSNAIEEMKIKIARLRNSLQILSQSI